jgi:hypothetical protein
MDIVGGNPAPAFDAAFALSGQTTPEPSSAILWLLRALALYGAVRLSKRPAIA